MYFSISGIDRSVRSGSRAVLCEGEQLRGCRFKASGKKSNPMGAGRPAPFSLLNILWGTFPWCNLASVSGTLFNL